MKNNISVILLLLISVLSFSQEEKEHEEHKEGVEKENEEEFGHHALLEERSFTFGLGVPYSFVLDAPGINSRFYYNIGEQICLGPEFSYFKKDEEAIYDMNFIGHYIFETKIAGVYPLAGVNYTIETSEYETERAFGLVAGAGLHRSFNRIMLFAEYSHVFSELHDDFATLGVMYHFK